MDPTAESIPQGREKSTRFINAKHDVLRGKPVRAEKLHHDIVREWNARAALIEPDYQRSGFGRCDRNRNRVKSTGVLKDDGGLVRPTVHYDGFDL
jgi:hypothetical protein